MTQNYVLTLIADPKSAPLTPALLKEAEGIVTKAKGSDTAHVSLSEGEAADILFSSDEVIPISAALEAFLADKPVDWALQDIQKRQKWLLVTDMDSTVIGQECIDEIADFAGLKQEVAAITEAAMNGQVDFAAALKQRVALLKGMEESVLEKVYKERITFTPGAKTLIATMRKKGARTLLISGGFAFFTSRVAEALGFDGEIANILGVENGKLTGEVQEPILDKQVKEMILRRMADKLKLPLALTMAAGDGANDLPMLLASGLGIAYRAKELVKKEADVPVDYGDLTALLYLQGYKKADFAAA